MALKDKLKKDDSDDDKDATASDAGAEATQDKAARGSKTTAVAIPDVPGDAPADEGSDDEPQRRDAISHNLLGTPKHPVDPISHNRLYADDKYTGDDDLKVDSILESEVELKRQLRALPTERLHILAHAVNGESASR